MKVLSEQHRLTYSDSDTLSPLLDRLIPNLGLRAGHTPRTSSCWRIYVTGLVHLMAVEHSREAPKSTLLNSCLNDTSGSYSLSRAGFRGKETGIPMTTSPAKPLTKHDAPPSSRPQVPLAPPVDVRAAS